MFQGAGRIIRSELSTYPSKIIGKKAKEEARYRLDHQYTKGPNFSSSVQSSTCQSAQQYSMASSGSSFITSSSYDPSSPSRPDITSLMSELSAASDSGRISGSAGVQYTSASDRTPSSYARSSGIYSSQLHPSSRYASSIPTCIRRTGTSHRYNPTSERGIPPSATISGYTDSGYQSQSYLGQGTSRAPFSAMRAHSSYGRSSILPQTSAFSAAPTSYKPSGLNGVTYAITAG